MNRLIAALPDRDRRRTLAECEIVELAHGETLQAKGRLNRIYFPTSGFISLIMPIDGVAALEIGLIGSEGACGFQLALGMEQSGVEALVQGAGSALRMEGATFARHLETSSSLARLMNRYIYVHLNELAQLAACTRFHLVEQRLARWLLMSQDRAHTETIYLTQQMLGSILGVRRVGITKAAGTLQARGLIRYSRGNITVLNRRGLKNAACGCYAANRRLYAKTLG